MLLSVAIGLAIGLKCAAGMAIAAKWFGVKAAVTGVTHGAAGHTTGSAAAASSTSHAATATASSTPNLPAVDYNPARA